MDASGAEDGTDFRPFFDMVIGILFVMLILVAAQIYFQQVQADTAANDDAKREAALRRAEIAAFLQALGAQLRTDGLTPKVDAENGTVVLPLREVMAVGVDGLPTVDAAPAARLGAAVAGLAGCVTVPRRVDAGCTPFGRLDLAALSVTTRVGALPPGAALSTDRFGDLGSALLAAKLMSGDPALVAASTAAGGRVVGFGTATMIPSPAAISGSALGGDLALDFTFQ